MLDPSPPGIRPQKCLNLLKLSNLVVSRFNSNLPDESRWSAMRACSLKEKGGRLRYDPKHQKARIVCYLLPPPRAPIYHLQHVGAGRQRFAQCRFRGGPHPRTCLLFSQIMQGLRDFSEEISECPPVSQTHVPAFDVFCILSVGHHLLP